jgi:hypothetical protein
MPMYNSRDYWFVGLRPSSGILKSTYPVIDVRINWPRRASVFNLSSEGRNRCSFRKVISLEYRTKDEDPKPTNPDSSVRLHCRITLRLYGIWKCNSKQFFLLVSILQNAKQLQHARLSYHVRYPSCVQFLSKCSPAFVVWMFRSQQKFRATFYRGRSQGSCK